MKSKTPRTDKEHYVINDGANYGMGDKYGEHVVRVEFARKLETELRAALAKLKSLIEG